MSAPGGASVGRSGVAVVDLNKALFTAVVNGEAEKVSSLIGQGASVDQVYFEDATVLHLAAWKGHAAVVKILLADSPALVDRATTSGATALHLAARNGHAKVVRDLLEAGASIDKVTGDGRKPLQLAEESENVEIVKILKEREVQQKRWNPLKSVWLGAAAVVVVNEENQRSVKRSKQEAATAPAFQTPSASLSSRSRGRGAAKNLVVKEGDAKGL